MRRFPFRVRIYAVGEGGREHELIVKGWKFQDRPASYSGHPDEWTPPVGGEIEDEEVFLARGRRERRLCPAVERSLLDDQMFFDRMIDALEGDS